MTAAATSPTKLFLTLAEAAEATGLSTRTLREAVNAGKLKAKRTGEDGTGRFLFRVAHLESWFDALEDA